VRGGGGGGPPGTARAFARARARACARVRECAHILRASHTTCTTYYVQCSAVHASPTKKAFMVIRSSTVPWPPCASPASQLSPAANVEPLNVHVRKRSRCVHVPLSDQNITPHTHTTVNHPHIHQQKKKEKGRRHTHVVCVCVYIC
jgi:hypothetical protein